MWPIVLIILAALYVLSPYDLLPDIFFGPGWIDDLVIIGFLARYLYNLKKNGKPSRNIIRIAVIPAAVATGLPAIVSPAPKAIKKNRQPPPGIRIEFWKSNAAPHRKKSNMHFGNWPASTTLTKWSIWAKSSRPWPRSDLRKSNGRMRS